VFGRGNNYEETIKVSGHTEKEKTLWDWTTPSVMGLRSSWMAPSAGWSGLH